MRSLNVVARTAVLGLFVGCAALSSATFAEDLPMYRVRETERSPAVEVPDLELRFPVGQLPNQFSRDLDLPFLHGRNPIPGQAAPSSRRESARRLWLQSQGEPQLFAPDDDRPLKPMAGGWSETPLWQADYVDTWGAHPATPAPVPSPRYGLRVSDPNIIPVAGETPVKTACADSEKCSKCDKCSTCDKCSKCDKCEACKCDNCSGKDCKACETQLDQGETAKVILELMETLGKSVLDGTVFQKPGQEDQEWLKELSADGQVSPREALIQYIRHLEAQQERSRKTSVAANEEVEELEFDVEFAVCPLAKIQGVCQCPECECPGLCRNCPAECAECCDCPGAGMACAALAVHAPRLQDEPGSEVEVLREMSAHLDMAANELERREIYQRADQLREVAGQLRQDARHGSLARATRKRAGVFFSRERYPLVPPPADVHTQLDELRQELKRTQAQLEQARNPRR